MGVEGRVEKDIEEMRGLGQLKMIDGGLTGAERQGKEEADDAVGPGRVDLGGWCVYGV